MMPRKIAQTHYNAMELLVAQEVTKQLKSCPATLREYINPIEVATFALNRLPPLYASCKEGLNRQQNHAFKLQIQIQTAVRQGFAAVHRDPIRQSTPLDKELNQAVSLSKKKQLPQNKIQSNLVHFLEQVLLESADSEITEDELNQILSQIDGEWDDPLHWE